MRAYGRVLECLLVLINERRQRPDRKLETGLQHRSAALGARSFDAEGLRAPSSRGQKNRIEAGPTSGAGPSLPEVASFVAQFLGRTPLDIRLNKHVDLNWGAGPPVPDPHLFV